MSTSAPALCALCPSWYNAENQIADRVLADTTSSRMVTSVDECQAKWQCMVFFWAGYLTAKGWSVLEASLQSTLASGRNKTIKDARETREGKQSRCSSEKFKVSPISRHTLAIEQGKSCPEASQITSCPDTLREGQCVDHARHACCHYCPYKHITPPPPPIRVHGNKRNYPTDTTSSLA